MSTGPKFSSVIRVSSTFLVRCAVRCEVPYSNLCLSLRAPDAYPFPVLYTPFPPLQVKNAAEALARDSGRSEAGVDGLLQHVSE